MNYLDTTQAVFVDRPNRFIANILLDGRPEGCHVKNTGRCGELFLPGSKVIVQERAHSGRKTKFDLIAVYKGARLVNVDSQAPNRVFAQWLQTGGLFEHLTLLRPELRFGRSRLDFYIEGDNRRVFAEIKGVTLEDGGIARFPDAPTQRGIRHLSELTACVEAGFEALAVFIVQMKGVRCFEPNRAVHPDFGDALKKAEAAGVGVLAFDCTVSENSIDIADPVAVRI